MNDTPRDTPRTEPQSFRAREMMACMTVRDLTKSAAWYQVVLGFTLDKKYERDSTLFAVSLKAGSIAILLTQDDGAKGSDRQKGEGFSLQFTTTQNIDHLATRIKAAGGTLQTEPADTRWGARMFRVTDLDGFKLVFSSVT